MNRKTVHTEIIKSAQYLIDHADEIALKNEGKYNLTFIKICINFDEDSISHVEIDTHEFENQFCLEKQRKLKPKLKLINELEEKFKKQLTFLRGKKYGSNK